MFVISAMHVLVAAAVFIMLPYCGVLGSALDTALSDDVASLLDTMKAQESLNQELTPKLLRHENKLWQQVTLIEELTTKLLRHEEKLSQQERLNQELTTKLLRHENKLSQQENLLARQDGTLFQQGRLIQQLRFAVAASRASTNVSLTSATVSLASATVSHASATVSRASALEDTVPTSRHVSIVDVMDGPDPETPDSRADSAVSGRIVAKRSDSGHNVVKQSAAVQNVAKQADSGHYVVKRSDDGGPLEAVVNQISQRVTEMGAELQALKTQTTSDLNALSIKTTSDLHTLRTRTTSDLQTLKNQTTTNLEALKIQTTADVQALQNSDRQQAHNILDARTSTFVRWGSSTCGNSSSLVYSGIVGGSWYDDTGAAADYLCLTLSPVPSQHSPPLSYAKLYGGEYQTQDSHQDKDPLCAVCRAAFSTTVMVPGTDTCSPGWHRHYSGFLMAGHYGNNAGSQYICVDPALESAPHGDANENGKLLYYTVTACGSLPCGPYVNNKVVTCAVCSM